MTYSKRFQNILFSLTCITCTAAWADAELPAEIRLFNGKDLEGWRVLEGGRSKATNGEADDAIFVVKQEVIHVYPTQTDDTQQDFAALVTEAEYENYVLTLQYKWGDKKFAPRNNSVRDAGLIFHVCNTEVFWPHGMECQIQEGDTGDIWALGTQVTSTVSGHVRNYDAKGKRHTRGKENFYGRFHRSYCWEQPGWNQLEIMVEGDHAIYKVNGHVVNEAIDMRRWDEASSSWQPLTHGPIALQAEGAEIFYREIVLEPLE